MKDLRTTRRTVLSGMALTGLGTMAGLRAAQAALPMPTSPVTLSIIDVAGNLQLTQKAFEAYRAAKPNLVSKISFTQATAPELPGKIKAQQDAGRVDIDMVLSGNDGLAAGIQQNLWAPVLTQYADALPKMDDILNPLAKRLATAAQNQAVIVVACPGGPIIEYMPDKVKTVPQTAEELLDWCKQNPKRFMYARPANSGPGRAFMMGLPYMLGDKDPKDPEKGWDKAWAYMEEMSKYIEYYPTGTGAVFKEFGDGTRDMVASHTGWDVNPRVLGIVPKEAKIVALKNFHWIGDSHFMCIPKGLPPEKMAVLLDLMSFMLQPTQQAMTYDKGYFYPGPAVKDVPLSMAPKESQDAVGEFGRPEYAKLISDNPIELPLDAAPLVYAFNRWDKQVGSKVAK
jgi:putative spermidine/putrescine transport system substrate-binding protein